MTTLTQIAQIESVLNGFRIVDPSTMDAEALDLMPMSQHYRSHKDELPDYTYRQVLSWYGWLGRHGAGGVVEIDHDVVMA